jgi:hypothetical protein
MRFALITRLECTELRKKYIRHIQWLRKINESEKCSEKFRSYRMLYEHTIQIHSY